jgi:hypothetical protein
MGDTVVPIGVQMGRRSVPTRLTLPVDDPTRAELLNAKGEPLFSLNINPAPDSGSCLMPGIEGGDQGVVARSLATALSLFLPP